MCSIIISCCKMKCHLVVRWTIIITIIIIIFISIDVLCLWYQCHDVMY